MKGRWYIQASNFKLWLDGKYSIPGNNYTNFRLKNKKLRFDDLLIFYKGEKENHIKGKLVQKDENKLDFVWKGKGLFFWMKSKWRIVASDAEGQWIVLYSTKTATSPEGMDVMSKNKKMSEKEVREIISHVDKKYVTKEMHILK